MERMKRQKYNEPMRDRNSDGERGAKRSAGLPGNPEIHEIRRGMSTIDKFVAISTGAPERRTHSHTSAFPGRVFRASLLSFHHLHAPSFLFFLGLAVTPLSLGLAH